jgi:hypothetical protein
MNRRWPETHGLRLIPHSLRVLLFNKQEEGSSIHLMRVIELGFDCVDFVFLVGYEDGKHL